MGKLRASTREASANSLMSPETSKPRDIEMTKKLMALAITGAAMLMAGPALADGYKRAPAAVACCDAN